MFYCRINFVTRHLKTSCYVYSVAPNSTYPLLLVLFYYISAKNVLRKGLCVGRESAGGITTRYGLDGPGTEIFRTRPDRVWGPTSFLYNVYRVLHEGKVGGAWR